MSRRKSLANGHSKPAATLSELRLSCLPRVDRAAQVALSQFRRLVLTRALRPTEHYW
jgi:hypothetical protein